MATDPNDPMASAGGSYDSASGLWKSGNDSVASKVNGLMQSGNPYVEQAKAAGTDYANSRGVQNSSIAAGASQKAAYDAVVPIATADANNATQKDLSAQGYAQQTGINQQQNTFAASQQAQQIASSEKIAQLHETSQATIAQLNISAAAQQQAAQIIADAAKQAAQLTSDASLAQLHESTQTAIAGMNISDADKQQLQQIASNELMAANTNAKDLNIADRNVASNAQDKSASAAVLYAQAYSNQVNAINGNAAMPADARATALANAKTFYDNGMSLVEQTYNVQLDWGQNAPPATPAATPTPTPAPTTDENGNPV